jgi:hypothetical protein
MLQKIMKYNILREMFRTYITIIGLIFFLLLLLIIYLETYFTKTNIYNPFPIERCPDYWIYDSKKKMCVIPKYGQKNVGKLYKKKKLDLTKFPENTVMQNKEGNYLVDFENDKWLFFNPLGKKTSLCIMKKWCNTNEIIWGGVSNYSGCN